MRKTGRARRCPWCGRGKRRMRRDRMRRHRRATRPAAVHNVHTLRERVAMSSRKYRAVFFDVDGVLLDSLPQHLAICRDKASEYGLPIEIPDVPAFRRMVAAGIKVSPM